MHSNTQKKKTARWHVNGKFLFFTAPVQRISTCDEIQTIILLLIE